MPKQFFEEVLAPKVKENPNLLKSVGVKNIKVAIVIDGPNGGSWTLGFNAEGCASLVAGAAPDAQCTISTSDKTFQGMIDGTVNVPMAFLMRKIKIKGDSGLAAKIGLALRNVG